MFEMKGDRAQWQVIYEHLAELFIGDVVKDAELLDLLPDASETTVRSAFYRAMQEMETEHSRSFTRVRLVGYRMVEAAEHERLARDQHRKAKRRLRTAHRKAHSADRSLLTSEERRRIDAVEMNLAQQQDMISRLDERVSRTEKSLKDARREQRVDAAELSDRIDGLKELLERHGITQDEAATP